MSPGGGRRESGLLGGADRGLDSFRYPWLGWNWVQSG